MDPKLVDMFRRYVPTSLMIFSFSVDKDGSGHIKADELQAALSNGCANLHIKLQLFTFRSRYTF